jgi:hypothetical protein
MQNPTTTGDAHLRRYVSDFDALTDGPHLLPGREPLRLKREAGHPSAVEFTTEWQMVAVEADAPFGAGSVSEGA